MKTKKKIILSQQMSEAFMTKLLISMIFNFVIGFSIFVWLGFQFGILTGLGWFLLIDLALVVLHKIVFFIFNIFSTNKKWFKEVKQVRDFSKRLVLFKKVTVLESFLFLFVFFFGFLSLNIRNFYTYKNVNKIDLFKTFLFTFNATEQDWTRIKSSFGTDFVVEFHPSFYD